MSLKGFGEKKKCFWVCVLWWPLFYGESRTCGGRSVVSLPLSHSRFPSVSHQGDRRRRFFFWRCCFEPISGLAVVFPSSPCSVFEWFAKKCQVLVKYWGILAQFSKNVKILVKIQQKRRISVGGHPAVASRLYQQSFWAGGWRRAPSEWCLPAAQGPMIIVPRSLFYFPHHDSPLFLKSVVTASRLEIEKGNRFHHRKVQVSISRFSYLTIQKCKK